MEEQNEKLEAMFVNPEKLVDAKLFTMSQELKESDLTREAQFNKLQNALKKLLYSLREQSQG